MPRDTHETSASLEETRIDEAWDATAAEVEPMTAEAKSRPDSDGDAAEMDALIGRKVGGRFIITGRIARGGMACVYSATQAQVNRPVAIKVLRSSVVKSDASAADFRRRFLQEAEILSRLQHPNLVTLLDYGQIEELRGEHYYIAMEYLQGETLARRFRRVGRLGVAQSIRIARQIGRGLREAHRQGFVHRDLKPSNIMLVPEDDESDIVKLIDFGIGKVVQAHAPTDAEEEDHTRVGLLLGSPRYMAPEQIRGEPVEPRTDLYGLGIILFQSLTGRVPFEHTSDVETMLAHCGAPPPPLDAYVEEPTGSLPELVADLLQKRAEDRPTIHDFLARLANVEAELFDSVGLAGPTLFGNRPSTAPRPSFGSIRPPPPPPRPSRPPALSVDEHVPRLPSEPPTVVTTGSLAASLSASTPPWARPAEPSPHSKKWAWVLVAIMPVLLWLGLREEPPKEVRSPAPSATSPTLAASFVLNLDSVPSQAVVREDGTVLGHTPLRISITRESVSARPRRFTLEHEGYAPYTHEQAESATDTSVVTSLVREAGPAAESGRKRGRKREVPPPAVSVEKPRAPERLDINLAR